MDGLTTVLWQPAVSIVVLLTASLFIWVIGEKGEKAVTAITASAITAALLFLAPLSPYVLDGHVQVIRYPVLPPFGLSFRVELLSISLALLFLFIGLVLTFYTGAYPLESGKRRFKTVFLFVLACSVGVVLAGDLLSLFLFFEAMSLSFFILIIHNRERETISATFKFLYMTIGGSVLYFIAMAAVFNQAGDLAWRDGGIMTAGGPYTLLAFIGFAVAFGMKAGMFPLHLWMPDAYGQAPPPAATLSSMVMLKTGAYGMLRITHHVFGIDLLRDVGWHNYILVLAVISILYGSSCAFAERDLLRRLAYSGVAQLGYIILGITILTPDALTGGVYHIMAHAMMKGTLLLCAGAILAKTGKRKIDDLAGIGWQMPFTMTCFSLAALTAVGLPPMNIFISKWHLGLGALDSGQPLLLVVLLISSMLNAAYYLPIAIAAFFGERNHDLHEKLSWDRLPLGMSLSIVVLTVGCLAFGLGQINIPLQWARAITAGFFY